MNSQPQSSTMPERITYVVVVHGMGEQRLNSTLIDVVDRFSEASRDLNIKRKRNVVTLGQATGQTGYYTKAPYPVPVWTEFEGISHPPVAGGTPFYGQKALNYPDPNNIRFLEIYWQDILRSQWDEVGQSVEPWIEAVIGRTERRIEFLREQAQAAKTEKQRNDPGQKKNRQKQEKLLATLYSLEGTLGLLNKATKFRSKELNDLAFAKYLGDVQVYNESFACRREAIGRFHALMDHLHLCHEKETSITPEYIVLAHSLGTVMSFDALVAAHMGSKPWINYVTSFITLGSPLDKILTLWWNNYEFLKDPIPKGQREKRIAHYNYSDEQDPVGHYLDDLETMQGYNSIFEKKEDRVYNRSILPGLAHTSYWQDVGLFKRIANQTVFKKEVREENKFWFDGKKYALILAITYFFVPLLVAGADFIMLTWALKADTWQANIIYSLGFVLMTWFGRNLLLLLIGWRMSSKKAALRNEDDLKASSHTSFTLLLWALFAVTVFGSALGIIFFPFGTAFVVEKRFFMFLLTIAGGGACLFLISKLTSKRKQELGVRVGDFRIDAIVFAATLIILYLSSLNGHFDFEGNMTLYSDQPGALKLSERFYIMSFLTIFFVVNCFSMLTYLVGKKSLKELPIQKV